jgi:predicted alpha/beta superfamily hydrolase
MKSRLVIICLPILLHCHLAAQMTLLVNNVPQLTPMFDQLYIAGDFNDWNPGDPAWQLSSSGGIYSITIPEQNTQEFEFKFTRGNWDTVEGNELGSYLPNRSASYNPGGTATYEIAGWEDLPGTHTVTSEVRIVDNDFVMPQLSRTRRIWVCLPEGYEFSTEHYPVIYMHDGQNLFDAATSFAGEWGADEQMSSAQLASCVKAIIVGVDNGGSSRIDEYAPWINTSYQEGGEGTQYAAFIAETLKPFIDEHFRTLASREYTFTMGSSLGALIAMYIATEYNDVFSGAALLSPAFWFNEEIYDHVSASQISPESKFYFVCGTNESSNLVNETQQMYDAVAQLGIGSNNNSLFTQNGGTHNEYWWNNYFPEAVLALITCNNQISNIPSSVPIKLYPNPAKDSLFIDFTSGEIIAIEVIDATGKTISMLSSAGNNMLDIRSIQPGMYHLRITYKSGNEQVVTTQTFQKAQ